MPKTENLQPPDEPATKTCPECYGVGEVHAGDSPEGSEDCSFCEGTGEIIIEDNNETENDNDND